MSYIIISVMVFGLLVVFKTFGQQKENQLKYDDFKKEINKKGTQLVDVRTAAEYKQGAINKAKNINVLSADFLEKTKQLDKNKPVYLYCRSGKRSQKALKILQKHGFKEVYDLEGGYLNWQSNGN
ncbi:rhodanese-like domain-containing protein [Wenyingzhuangia sp. IMCC45467]